VTRSSHDPENAAIATLDQELRLVGDAVAMVAMGGSPRVVLVGLRFSEQLIEPARRMVVGKHVRIVALWTTDEGGLDIAVERDSDG
jgi:hypothetical protein